MSKRKLKSFDPIPGKDVFDNVINPGDAIAMATKSAGNVYIAKGRYLGSRMVKWGRESYFYYIVEKDLVHRARTSAAGELWHDWRVFPNPRTKEQDQEMFAEIGLPPTPPTRTMWNIDRKDSVLQAEIKTEWAAYREVSDLYENKKEAWLDIHYPYKSTPYVRRSTLWLNKIIKL